jgi:hypothetical protein
MGGSQHTDGGDKGFPEGRAILCGRNLVCRVSRRDGVVNGNAIGADGATLVLARAPRFVSQLAQQAPQSEKMVPRLAPRMAQWLAARLTRQMVHHEMSRDQHSIGWHGAGDFDGSSGCHSMHVLGRNRGWNDHGSFRRDAGREIYANRGWHDHGSFRRDYGRESWGHLNRYIDWWCRGRDAGGDELEGDTGSEYGGWWLGKTKVIIRTRHDTFT